MSVIKVTLPPGEIPAEGKMVSFKAPCTCTVTDGIEIEGVTYTVCDALGKCVTGVGGVWDTGSVVTVVLSMEQKKAYVQNNAGYSPSNKPSLADVCGSNENLLCNWYFADPINQRGQTEYSGNGVTIDRWRIVHTTASITLGDNGVTLRDPTTGYYALRHSVSNYKEYIGKTLTLSCLVAEASGETRLNAEFSSSGSVTRQILDYSEAGLHSVSFTVPDDADRLHISFATRTGFVSTTVSAIKLELGSVQTLAHQDADGNWVLNDPPPDKGMELLKCIQSVADSSDDYANKTVLHTGNRDLVNKLFTATLSTSWTTSGNYFYQDVAVSGLLATDTPVVGVNPGSDNAANVQYSMGFSNVFRVTTSANSIRVWARAKPTVAIPIQIKVVR